MAVIVGIDEVGRGAVAGPIVAGAVATLGEGLPPGVADSKTVSAKKRFALDHLIQKTANVSIGLASPQEIDNKGIQRCNLLAMKRALEGLRVDKVDLVVVDGRFSMENLATISLESTIKSIVHGDEKIPVISAASICAKVFRDSLMKKLHAKNSAYGWDKNFGYGTQSHVRAMKEKGLVSGVHRLSFKINLF